MTITTLPPVLALQSTVCNKTKYLRLLNSSAKALEFSANEVLSPYARFHVERASSGRDLVHIRSSYNNKYWVVGASAQAAEGNNAGLITADADEPEEDQSKTSCTLFKHVFQQDGTVRLLHINRNHYLGFSNDPLSCLSATYADTHPSTAFTVIDYDSLVVFPRRIAFRSITNENYLAPVEPHNEVLDDKYLQFGVPDAGDPRVEHEVSSNPDGSIHIKSVPLGRYWTVRSGNDDWVLASADTDMPDTSFWPIKCEDNVITLRSLANNKFCKRDTGTGNNGDQVTDSLRAIAPIIDRESQLEVSELVTSRSVDVEFRLSDARIYQHSVLTMGIGAACNTTNENLTLDVKVSCTETKSSTWNTSTSLRLGSKLTIKSRIPLISSSTQIELLGEFSGEYEWGQVHTSSSTVKKLYQVTVPPMSQVTVRAIGTTATCDVPFSYIQHDVLNNGDHVTSTFEDGVYTGINAYGIHYEEAIEKLDSAKPFIK